MHALAALLFLFLGGTPLAFALTRRLVMTLVVAPLVTALMCTAAGFSMVLIGGRMALWLPLLFVVQIVAAWLVLGRPRRWPASRSPGAPEQGSPGLPPVSGWDVVIMFVPLAVPALLVLLPPTGWDARSIWWFHASWFSSGGSALRDALGNPVFAFSHADYPPLAPATIAGSWAMSGSTSLRIAQTISTLLTLAAIAMLAYGVRQLCASASAWLARLAGLAVGLSAWMLASVGVATGYVDHLWAAALAGAAVLLLIEPHTTRASLAHEEDLTEVEAASIAAARVKLTLGVLLATVAALTKNEGFVAAILLALVFSVRARHRLRLAAPAWIPVAAGLAWTMLAHGHGAASDLANSPRITQLKARDFTPFERVHPTLTAIGDLIGPYLLASAAITVVGAIFLHRVRRRTGMASSAWIWATVALYVGAIVMTYVVSPWDLAWHLATSLDRVCIVIVLLLAANTASWFLTAVSRPGVRANRGPVHRPAPEVPDLTDLRELSTTP